MNGAVHPTAAGQPGVGRVDDGFGILLGDISGGYFKSSFIDLRFHVVFIIKLAAWPDNPTERPVRDLFEI